jgi:branched-chain amino acid transport system permease protein
MAEAGRLPVQPGAQAAERLIRVLQQPFVPPLILGVVGVLIVEWFAADAHWLNAISLMTVYAVLTVGLNFAQGQSGLFTMGTAAFMGVGGYSTAYLTTAQHWAPILALVAGVVLALAVGGLFALLTLRISDIYLAIATLALVQIFGGLVLAYSTVTNGVNGITSIPPLGIGSLVADDVLKNALLDVGILTVLAVAASLILTRRPGREMRAVREDHLAAAGAGVGITRSLILAFVLAATYGAVAGSLYAHTIAFVDPTAFTLDLSVTTIAMLVIGGSGSVLGAILGAFLLQYAAALLTDFKAYSSLLFGLVVLFGTLVSPLGITGSGEQVIGRVPILRRWLVPPTRSRGTRPAAARIAVKAGHEAEQSKQPELEARGISKSFGGVNALQDVSLTVRCGEIHALIGPNGSGKSTLINVLSGLYRADAGSVSIGDRRLDGLAVSNRASSGLARTYQNGRLFKALTVYENVHIASDHRSPVSGPLGARFPGVAGRAWVELLIDLAGISELESFRAGLLGFGNQRRVELARALALDPQFLLLDEPAAGLSDTEKDGLVELLRDFTRTGMGILLVEHSMDVVMRVADVVTVLDFGRVIAHGSPVEIRQDTGVVEAYLGVA